MASSFGHGADDDSGVIRAYMPTCTDSVKEASTRPTSTSELTPASSPSEVAAIGMVGLGAMGQGMAASLLWAGFAMNGFDMNAAAASKCASFGSKARAVSSAADALLKILPSLFSWSKMQHKLTIYCLVRAMEPTPCLTIRL
ncbi:ketose-bisphosphate aldolase class-ii family protein [Beauveria brongniartii RCEF 3172]|uniref:Ketose-bisphosphate aldolase class-ii family protein n=1 Tax=Beauveria brongniartii RCEF 3172 TaxID=1081107 RepID=A0A167HSK6_9HYPO|nr:ketose-bisphosphate aldolase class-ii family protein [Beauveria brongniartii RCEF 3172]